MWYFSWILGLALALIFAIAIELWSHSKSKDNS